MYDVVIIGAGVIGSAIARELSRYQLNTVVLEREEDVCCGTSKANSGIVHAGHDAKPGSLKAKMNVRGNQMMESLSRELDFPFRRNGSVVLCFHEEEIPRLEHLRRQGIDNGVEALRIVCGDEMRQIEPGISRDVKAMLYAPTGGIVCPFKLNIALAENAYVNGTQFFFDTCVQKISSEGGVQAESKGTVKGEMGFVITTNRGIFLTRAVVNAAGVYADVFNNMVSSRKLHITPRKGEYLLLDKKAGHLVDKTVFQLPTKLGKGVLVTPTVHGNLMAGPTAYDIEDREGTGTTALGMEEVIRKAAYSVGQLPFKQTITSFAGLRAHEDGDDFVIGEAEDVPGFFNAAGIESPGLTSAPAVGEFLAGMVAERLEAKKKEEFVAVRKDVVQISGADRETVQRMISENPAYGNVICRCETVTEGEILDAIRRPLGARSLDGIKRRTRAGMGRCQAGFCSPKVMEILAKELGVPVTEITKNGQGSELVTGYDKETLEG